MREVLKIVVPPSYLDSILTVLHIRLNHPKTSQLKQVFDRYFFSPRVDAALSSLSESCHLCVNLKKYPKELETYNPQLFPDHPGKCMNVDILKRSGQLILVNIDLFSSYVTACFTPSESAVDLAEAIVQVVTPIRHSGSLLVRADKAPGFLKLAASSQSTLSDVGIVLELGQDENKNSNCSVDRAISELEEELRIMSPSGDKISTMQLAQAVIVLNRKIRNRGLSASEIHFSRDSHDGCNLSLSDSQLCNERALLRQQNQSRLAHSRAPKETCTPNIVSPVKGDLVLLKQGVTKHTAREPHIVMNSDSQGKSVLRKALHVSPADNMPTKFSHRTKIVDNKFLFQPNIYKRDNVFESSCSHHDVDPNIEHWLSSPKSSTDSNQQWNPIADDESCDIIPTIPTSSVSLQPEFDLSAEISTDSHSLDSPPLLLFDEPHLDLPRQNNFEVVTFNDGESVDIPENLIQHRRPKVGDAISYYDNRLGSWRDATITTDLSRRWDLYFNIVYNDGQRDGLYLLPGTRWTFTHELINNEIDEVNRQEHAAAQSLHPTPESTPPQEDDHPPTASDLASSPHSFSSSMADASLNDDLNRTLHDSLEWDMTGTEFQSLTFERTYPLDLNKVIKLDGLLPLPNPTQPSSPLSSLSKVVNLERRLPLSSTPVLPHQRISRTRRPLPLELDDQPSSSFKRWLRNPFKKKRT